MECFSPLLKAYLTFLSLALGLVLGSFCNAWAWRIVHNESITRGRSHCPDCNHVLGAGDLVPLFSWLFLKGRCRYCSQPISPRYPLAEGLLGLCFVSLLLRFGLTLDLLRMALLFILLLTASLVDWESMLLPDGLLLAAAACALLRLSEPGAWLDMLIGALAVSLPLLVIVLIMDRLLKKETMGGGDIKLTAVLGLHFGPWLTLLLLIFSCLLGLLFALISKKGKGTEFPFGPILGIGAWFTTVFGDTIINWYLSLL